MKHRRFLASVLTLLLTFSLLSGFLMPAAEAAGSATYTDFVFFGYGPGVAALRSDGTVAVWDPNSMFKNGEIDRVRSWENVVQIMDEGRALLALMADGTVDAAEYDVYESDFNRSTVTRWRNIRELVCSNGYHGFAIGWDGKLYLTGKSNMINGMDRFDFSWWKNLKKLAAGVCPKSEYLLGLCWDGTVVDNRTYDSKMEGCDLPWSGETKNVVDIASDGWLDMALRADGTVVVRGTDREVYEPIVSKRKNVSGICFAGECPVALFCDGTVECAIGDETDEGFSSLHGVRELVQISDFYEVAALFTNGDVKVFSPYQYDSDTYSALDSWKNVTRLWANSGMAVGMQADGSFLTLGFKLSDLN